MPLFQEYISQVESFRRHSCAALYFRFLFQDDSGGPLMTRTWYDRDRFTLVGVATDQTGCGESNTPALFTRVYSFLDWLLDNMEDAVYC